jgi:hypothetical protein
VLAVSLPRLRLTPGAAPLAEQLAAQGLALPAESRLPACVDALAVLDAEGLLTRRELRAIGQRIAAAVEREAVVLD